MASFGTRLRQERERQGVTLEDISLSTKIGTRMLRALEEEHFDQLPGGIFNKGFIRAYARCLGMDEEQAITDYLDATGLSPAKNSEIDDQPPLLEPPSREENSAAGLPWGTFAVVLLIVALGFAAWGFYSRESQNETRDSAPPAATPPAVAPATAAEPSPPEQKSVASEDSAAAKPDDQPIATTSAIQPAASPPVSTSPSTDNQPQPPVPANGAFLVLIKAREDSWVSIAVDGEVVTQQTLIASAEKSVRAERRVVVRAGNVGALDFEFNGKRLPVQGVIGEVKTLIFDPHGLQPPAPKPEPPAPLP